MGNIIGLIIIIFLASFTIGLIISVVQQIIAKKKNKNIDTESERTQSSVENKTKGKKKTFNAKRKEDTK